MRSWHPRFVRNLALLNVVQARAQLDRHSVALRAAFVPFAQSTRAYANSLVTYFRALLHEAREGDE